MTAELSDAKLVHRCRAGEAEAWNELVERFSRYVYAIIVRGFRFREREAEDVFQEVFARVYDRLGSLRDDAAVDGSASAGSRPARARSRRGRSWQQTQRRRSQSWTRRLPSGRR